MRTLRIKGVLPMQCPLPGETFYGQVARIHVCAGLSNRRKIILHLQGHGAEAALLSPIPPALVPMARGFPPGHPARDPLKTLIEHTTYPYFRAFLPIDHELRCCVQAGKPQSRFRLGSTIFPISWWARVLSFCPDCFRQDLAEFGVPYWHREHQLPGVILCWRHATPLQYQCRGCGFHIRIGTAALALPGMCHCKGRRIALGDIWNWRTLEQPPEVARDDLLWLARESVYCLTEAPGRHELLREKLWLWFQLNGHVGRTGVNGQSLVDQLHRRFSPEMLRWLGSSSDRWIRSQLVYPALRWILLAGAFFGSVAAMDEALASFDVQDGRKQIEEIRRRAGKGSKHVPPADSLPQHKARLKAYLRDHPAAARTQVRSHMEQTLRCVQRHDPQWLNRVLPKSVNRARRRRRIDWSARDQLLASEVSRGFDAVLGRDRPVRATQTAVLKYINKHALVYHNLDQLPLTKAILESRGEDMDAFHRRRLKWTLLKLRAKDGSYNPKTVHLTSGLRLASLLENARFVAEEARALGMSFSGQRQARFWVCAQQQGFEWPR